jgi:hypothetical protein
MTENLSNLIIVLTVAVTTSGTPAGTLYVDDDAPPAGDGLGWTTACRFLQEALAIADASGGVVTEIRVGAGTYTPDRDESNPEGTGGCFVVNGSPGCPDPDCEAVVCAVLPLCCSIDWDANCASFAFDVCADARDETFQLLSGVALMGGYAGFGAPDPDDRDPTTYESALSGDLADNDGPGLFDNNEENAMHVVTASFTDSTAVLDGFTITAGHANGSEWPEFGTLGAGIVNESGSPTISQCVVTGNFAQYGAGMENLFGAQPTVTNTTFVSNTAGLFAGGIDFFTDVTATITGCTFANNTVLATAPPDGGGGMYIGSGNSVVVSDCVFSGNSARTGSGIAMFETSPVITGCLFTGNVSSWGAIACVTAANPTITNCTFIENASVLDVSNSGGFGGAILNWDNCSPYITGCLFRGNSAVRRGGAVYGRISCNPTLVNCTFVQNSAVIAGGAVAAAGLPDGVTTLRNCILWGNTAPQGPEIALHGAPPAEIAVFYSDVQGGAAGAHVDDGLTLTWGDGNIVANPLFVDAGQDDVRLSPGSPAIDAASNPAVPVGVMTDLDGNPRFVDDPCREDTGLGDPPIVDMGAYEFQDRSCDLDGSGTVGITDFLAMLAAWGPCPEPCPPSCPADFDGDCQVGVVDFLILLANWD